jgi:hypothetical protein
MQATNRWRAIGLCPVPVPTNNINTGRAAPRKPKPKNKKQTKKQTSKQEALVKESNVDDDNLNEALQSLSLGTN